MGDMPPSVSKTTSCADPLADIFTAGRESVSKMSRQQLLEHAPFSICTLLPVFSTEVLVFSAVGVQNVNMCDGGVSLSINACRSGGIREASWAS